MKDYCVRLIEPVEICWDGGKTMVVGNWFVFGTLVAHD